MSDLDKGAAAELHGGAVAELYGGAAAELHGKELYTFRNQHRREFATKAKLAYWNHPPFKIPKVDFTARSILNETKLIFINFWFFM